MNPSADPSAPPTQTAPRPPAPPAAAAPAPVPVPQRPPQTVQPTQPTQPAQPTQPSQPSQPQPQPPSQANNAAATAPSLPPQIQSTLQTIAHAHAASLQASRDPQAAAQQRQREAEEWRRAEEERRKRREEKRKERDEWVKRRDGSVGELMVLLDDYRPLIPDEVTDYYLQKSGFECEDPRLKRLLSLAAQKFVSDITQDAFYYAKLRTSASGPGGTNPSGGAAGGSGGGGAGQAAGGDEQAAGRLVLTMDDLGYALEDHGVDGRRPDYYF
ncbi:hypothetical protein QFC22_001671 [Naganishia vaughanmartiniae]|uniref:Uncharacterized protein n=1 Tax=Naganishia vaughanmartiniae TaxID=1424756 RepID=A0ACC2XFU2_9TREE|nr:hypothetical protein QFC22_001671 [Naganishia vaughanmartiniae]